MGKTAVQTCKRTQDQHSLFSAVPPTHHLLPTPHSFQAFPASLHRHPLHSQPPRMSQARCTCVLRSWHRQDPGSSHHSSPNPASLCSLCKNRHSSFSCTSAHTTNNSQGWGPPFLPGPDFSAVKQHEASWETQAYGIFLPPC